MMEIERAPRARTLVLALALALATVGCTGAGPESTGGPGAPASAARPSVAIPSGDTSTPASSDRPGDEPGASAGAGASTGAVPSRTIPRISPPAASVDTGAVPESILAEVRADAAVREGVAEDAVVLVRAEAIVWPDGALGCPEPGQLYTEALVPGYWVVVEAGGTTIDYRITQNGTLKVCANPPGPG
jgi:hypothetical protein